MSFSLKDRAQLEWELSDESDAPDGPSETLVRRLLQAYDDLEKKLLESYQENRELRARLRELEPL